MYYDNKYLTIYTGESYIEYPPFFYVDFFKTKPNLKRSWRDNYEFTFGFKFAKFIITLNIRWGFVERARAEEEEERYQRTMRFIKELNNEPRRKI